MSVWTARLIVQGGRASDGGLVGPSTLESLVPLLRGAPVCAHWVGDNFDHVPADSPTHGTLDLGAIVGRVYEVLLRRVEIFGRVSIAEPHLDRFLLNAERRGRLVETLGLSVYGRATMLPPEYATSGLWFSKVISVDFVGAPLGGGCLIQSDAAASAGAPWPTLPTITPPSRPTLAPTRERGVASSVRYAHTAPRSRRDELAEELPTIPPGGDYPPWQ